MTSTTGETLIGTPRPRAFAAAPAIRHGCARRSSVCLARPPSRKGFVFGSFHSSNFITVDKPPALLWVMDISARLFGG